jgi:hypothetical protein
MRRTKSCCLSLVFRLLQAGPQVPGGPGSVLQLRPKLVSLSFLLQMVKASLEVLGGRIFAQQLRAKVAEHGG